MPEVSSAKTSIDQHAFAAFLRDRLGVPVELVALKGGELSQAFEMRVPDRTLVARVGSRLDHFEKDRFAGDCLRTENLPVPRVIDVGTFSPVLAFAISEIAPGIQMDKQPDTEIALTLPSLMRALRVLHSTPPMHERGFGYWRVDREPDYSSWPEFLRASLADRRPVGRTFEEARKLASYWERFEAALTELPPVRTLIHGDPSFDNLFSRDRRVSAVIDWGESMCGDPIYDVAWIQFWQPGRDYLPLYQSEAPDQDHESVHDRLACYELYIGLRSLWFFQHSGQPQAYDFTIRRMGELLG